MSASETRLSLDRIRQAAGQVGRETGARLVVLFGSMARGEEAMARDLDIGILPRGALDTLALTNRLIRLLGVQEVDVADLRCADPVLLALVARDGVPLYEVEPGEFARFASVAFRRYADTAKFRDAERAAIRDFIAGRHEDR